MHLNALGPGNVILRPRVCLSLRPNAVLFVSDVYAVVWNIFVHKAHGADVDVVTYPKTVSDDAAVGADGNIIADADTLAPGS